MFSPEPLGLPIITLAGTGKLSSLAYPKAKIFEKVKFDISSCKRVGLVPVLGSCGDGV
jgi:hypothetical protein